MDQIRWIIYGIYTIAPPPPEKNCPPVRDGVWVKIRVNFMVGGGGQPDNCLQGKLPPVKARVWIRVSYGVGVQLSKGTIVLEPKFTLMDNYRK